MVFYEVKEQLADMGEKAGMAKRLTVTSWNGFPAKLDIRAWKTTTDPETPGKGITLTKEEAQILKDALIKYLGQ